MTMYELTEEHRAQLPAWKEQWKAVADRTETLTDEDRVACAQAIRNMYVSVNAQYTPIVAFARSPFEASIATGIAMGYYNKLEEGKEPNIQWDELTDDPVTTLVLTVLGKDPTVPRKTAPTPPAYEESSVYVPRLKDARRVAKTFGLDEEYAVEEIRKASNLWQMGNWGAGDVAFLSFFKDVVKLETVDFTKYVDWEKAAVHGCIRTIHERFAIVSDFPAELHQEELESGQRRKHRTDGPSVVWRDGSEEYTVHDVSIPSWVFRSPERLTVDNILAEENAEIRRVMLDMYGPVRFAADAKLEVLDEDVDELGLPLRLLRRELPGDEDLVVVEVTNSTVDPDGTRRKYMERVPPTYRKALAARNWGNGVPDDARFVVQT